MTPKQILDSFSETLMQDERILSAQERSLLAALLQRAHAALRFHRVEHLHVVCRHDENDILRSVETIEDIEQPR